MLKGNSQLSCTKLTTLHPLLLSCCAFICLFLNACSSTPDSQTVPPSDNQSQTKAQQGKKAALAARGFYQTPLGNINYLHARQCSDFEIQSHRGSTHFDENSLNAVIDALDNQVDVVEIDVRITRDDVWVVHHDAYTGRATGTTDNKRRKVESLSYKKEWRYVRHRDHNTGLLTKVVPPTFTQLASTFSRYKYGNQKLNIEIKSKATVDELKMLDYLAFKYLGEGNYYFSSLEMRNLTRMRDINPDIYLVYIQSPAKSSINQLVTSLKQGAGTDPLYERNKEQIESLQSLDSRRRKVTRYDRPLNLDKLSQLLKGHFGYALDIRHYQESAKRLKPASKARGIKLSTYSINGHPYHEGTLVALEAAYRPDSVIIDDTVYGFCTAFSLPTVTHLGAIAGDEQGISTLPDDLDLERLDELPTYINNGLYPALGGQLKSLTAASSASQSSSSPEPDFNIGSRQKDEAFSLETTPVVELEIRKKD